MKRIFERLKKFSLYFRSNIDDYARYCATDKIGLAEGSTIGYFPLDYGSTLNSSLFEKFDENGLPLKYMNGVYIYFHTKIFTYALAHWNNYLRTGNNESRTIVLSVAEYVIRVTEVSGENRLFREFNTVSRAFDGAYSGAMEQGLGAFILLGAFEITRRKAYLLEAEKCINILTDVEDDKGIVCEISGKTWFDEFPGLGRHVLNGHNDALIGLSALLRYSNKTKYKKLFDICMEDLPVLLNLFDTKIWSNYWYSSTSFQYIASMKYHSIHVHQLRYFAEVSGNVVINDYYIKWKENTKNVSFRMFALFLLVLGKIQMRILKRLD